MAVFSITGLNWVCISLTCLPVVAWSVVAKSEEIPKPSDDLLGLLRAAQLTNRAAFPSGELTAKVDSVWDGATIQTLATVLWQGGKTYWSYEKEERTPKRSSREKCEMIDDGNILLAFFPDLDLLQEIHGRAATYSEQLLLRPDQIWFRLEGIADWARLVEPVSPSSGGKSLTILASRLTDDRILVERRHQTGEVLRIEASLAARGNVVEYEGTSGRSGGIWRKGTYEWAQCRDGKCVLKSYDYQRSLTGSRRTPERKYHLEVTSFNPDPVIAQGRFSVSSLNVPSHAAVDIMTASGTRRVRNSQRKELDENALMELGDLVGSKGFAVKPDTVD